MRCDQFDEDRLIEFALAGSDETATDSVRQHLLACDACRLHVESLQSLLHEESSVTPPSASIQRLVPLLARQARAQASGLSWSLLWRRPALATASLALLALFFSVGYVQGNLVGRRTVATDDASTVAAMALPPPPDLGVFAVQVQATEWSSQWGTGAHDTVQSAFMPVDSL